MRELTKQLWYFVCRHILIVVPDRYFVQLTSFITYKRLGFRFKKLDLRNPVTFNEKLTFLKINKAHEGYSEYVDKIKVRKYVEETVGPQYLVPIIKIFHSAGELDLDSLPQSFVLKTNHGSGWNLICRDKYLLDEKKVKKKFKRWLKNNAFYLTREYQYKPIRPAIICEEMLNYNLYDYKFFCFKGKPQIIQVDIDRFTNHRRAFFNNKWERQDFSIRYAVSEKSIERPCQLNEMLDVCRKLSAPFQFVRVDLYVVDSHIYFGELTFTPGGGNEPFNPVESDYMLGKLLEI